MRRRLRALLTKRTGIAIVFACGLVIGILTSFGVERVRSADRILRGVSVGGVALGGLERPAALERMTRLVREIEQRRLEISVQKRRIEASPRDLGFRSEASRLVDAAFREGRGGWKLAQLGWWLARLFTVRSLPVDATIDSQALARVVETWERERIEPRAFPGAIVVGETVSAEYPREGLVVARRELESRLLDAATGAPRLEVPLATERPVLSRDDVERALVHARRLTSDPVTIRVPAAADAQAGRPEAITFGVSDLKAALRSQVRASPPELRVELDRALVSQRLDVFRGAIEVPSRDATFEIDARQKITVIPSSRGVRIDEAKVLVELEAATQTAERAGDLPLVAADPPKLETAEAEGLGIEHLVSRFTTFHNCCEPRVKNIHRIADLLDGVVVRPGQTFSVNEHVGPRTEAAGFVLAPTIVEGDMDKTIGGGVSQFATTLFNAVFDGGYEIIQRQPHSFYFPRYPIGHEATLSYPSPDLIFKNDTQAGLLIKTEYGDKHIRVLIYGDNGGRKVTRRVGPRIERTEPPIEYVANVNIPPDAAKLETRGVEGWSVLVYRTITLPDGSRSEQHRKVTYNPRPRVVEVHPCNIPKGEPGHTGEECPVPVLPDGGADTTESDLLSLEAISH